MSCGRWWCGVERPFLGVFSLVHVSTVAPLADMTNDAGSQMKEMEAMMT